MFLVDSNSSGKVSMFSLHVQFLKAQTFEYGGGAWGWGVINLLYEANGDSRHARYGLKASKEMSKYSIVHVGDLNWDFLAMGCEGLKICGTYS